MSLCRPPSLQCTYLLSVCSSAALHSISVCTNENLTAWLFPFLKTPNEQPRHLGEEQFGTAGHLRGSAAIHYFHLQALRTHSPGQDRRAAGSASATAASSQLTHTPHTAQQSQCCSQNSFLNKLALDSSTFSML